MNKIFFIDSGGVNYIKSLVRRRDGKTAQKTFKKWDEIDRKTAEGKIYVYPKIKKIGIDWMEIKKLLDENLQKYDEVRFDTSAEEIEENYFAYENEFCTVYGSLDNKKKVISLEMLLALNEINKMSGTVKEKTARLLEEIGKRYGLILIDWGKRHIIDISVRREINQYFDSQINNATAN